MEQKEVKAAEMDTVWLFKRIMGKGLEYVPDLSKYEEDDDFIEWTKKWNAIAGDNMEQKKLQAMQALLRHAFGRKHWGYFYSFCQGDSWESDSHTWHCWACGECQDWRDWHCEKCGKCSYDVSIRCQGCKGVSAEYHSTFRMMERRGS
jgi:hypothetical protein